MANQRTKDEGRRTPATLDDVLGAVNGVGQRVDALDNKVSSIDRRVMALERAPALKTRIVHQQGSNGNGQVQPQPVQQAPVEVSDEELEEEAIRSGIWEKVVHKSRCYRIDVSKVRSPQYADCWKLILRLRGERRPATLCSFDGLNQMIEMMREVWPAINEDIFDEALFEERWAEQRKVDPRAPMPIIHSDDNVLFEVEWFKTAPNYRGHTFINVERVYPIE